MREQHGSCHARSLRMPRKTAPLGRRPTVTCELFRVVARISAARRRSKLRRVTGQRIDQRSIDELRIAEARWRAVIDAAVDGIIVIDSKGRIEAFNASAERMFGYTEAELIGRNVSVLMPEPHRSNHDSYIDHHLQTGERKIIGIGRAVNGLTRDGKLFPL